MIVRRRKRPVEVTTVQWTGTNEAEVQAFAGGPSVFYALDAEDREGCDDPEATATVFDNLHSTWILVYTGQHIARGVKREHYPIADDVIDETYDTVDDSEPPFDARREDVLAEVVTWLIKKAREYPRRNKAGRAQADTAASLASQIRRGAVRPNNLQMLPATFFEPGRSYTSGTWQFRCEAISPSPSTGEIRALGWKYSPVYDVRLWHATALDPDDWKHGAWTDVTEGGEAG